MNKIFAFIAFFLITFLLCAEDRVSSFKEYQKYLDKHVTITFNPDVPREKVSIPFRSARVVSFLSRMDLQKPINEISPDIINHYLFWGKKFLKEKYVQDDANKISAFPNFVVLKNASTLNSYVFTWASDILISVNNTDILSYSWDNGSFFVFCMIKGVGNSSTQKEIEKHLKSILAKYSNIHPEDIDKYKFEFSENKNQWQGTMKYSEKSAEYWRESLHFLIGSDFTCFSFLEYMEKPSQISRAGDAGRFR